MNKNRLFYSPTFSETENEKINDKSLDNKPKINFKKTKENTIKSLNEVEFFLNNFKRFKRYLHLYKFFK